MSNLSKKYFINYSDIVMKSIRLTARIYQDQFIPDVIYVILRGGAYLGNILSELLQMTSNKDVFYAAVVVRSYTQSNQAAPNIVVEGWTYPPDRLRKHDKILLVDDIFDTGRTVNFLKDKILDQGLTPDNVRIAVLDYKSMHRNEDITCGPDYFCHLVDARDWVHYLTHEFRGLTIDEIKDNYKIEIQNILMKMINHSQ